MRITVSDAGLARFVLRKWSCARRSGLEARLRRLSRAQEYRQSPLVLLITFALVMLRYTLSFWPHVSSAIAVVVAGREGPPLVCLRLARNGP